MFTTPSTAVKIIMLTVWTEAGRGAMPPEDYTSDYLRAHRLEAVHRELTDPLFAFRAR